MKLFFLTIVANNKKSRNISYGYVNVKTRFLLNLMFRHKPPYEQLRHI